MSLRNSFTPAILAALAIAFMLFSCAPVSERPPKAMPSGEEATPEKQEAMAMVEYEKILDDVTERGKRNMLPELEKSYEDLIARYPDAYLAQESYWRLVEMNLTDYFPPRMDRAEQIRNEFIAKYPDSRMIRIVDDSMVRYYHRNNHWERLLEICSYHVRKYIDSGKLESPLFMFYYAEAKFHLNDLVEAEKAYKIIMNTFPGSHEARLAKQQVREINMSKKSTDR